MTACVVSKTCVRREFGPRRLRVGVALAPSSTPAKCVSMRARVVASSVGERKSTEMASRKWSAGLKSRGTGAPSAAKCAEHWCAPSPAYIKRPPESSTS